MLECEVEDDVTFFCRLKANEDISCSGWEAIGRLEKPEENYLYYGNGMAVEVLQKHMGGQMESQKNMSESYVSGTVMHTAQLDAGTQFVATTMDIEVGRVERTQALCSELYEGTCVVQ